MSEPAETLELVDVYVMGKHFQVPEGMTIQAALEYAGYNLIRGVGCRSGFCGACATVYCFKNDPQLRYALACQKAVDPDMYLTQMPFFPAASAQYDIEELTPVHGENSLLKLYPDMLTCFGCNNCTKSCPQDLLVMEYVAVGIRGDYQSVYEKSFDCLMCGLCAARCPQGLRPYVMAIAARRLRGAHFAPKSQHNLDRIEAIESGEFDSEMDHLKTMSQDDLRRLYAEREIEPAR